MTTANRLVALFCCYALALGLVSAPHARAQTNEPANEPANAQTSAAPAAPAPLPTVQIPVVQPLPEASTRNREAEATRENASPSAPSQTQGARDEPARPAQSARPATPPDATNGAAQESRAAQQDAGPIDSQQTDGVQDRTARPALNDAARDAAAPEAIARPARWFESDLLAPAFAALALALAVALGGVWWALRRKNRSKPARAASRATGHQASPPPASTRPQDASGASSGAAGAAKEHMPVSGLALDHRLDILSIQRSLMMVTVDFRLTLVNRTERALRDVTAAVQLVCARRDMPSNPDGEFLALEAIARLAPHQVKSLRAQVTLPTSLLAVIYQGTRPMFVPLLRLRIAGANLDQIEKSYALGLASASGRLHPLPLDTPPGSYGAVRARPID